MIADDIYDYRLSSLIPVCMNVHQNNYYYDFHKLFISFTFFVQISNAMLCLHYLREKEISGLL